jgi:5-methylcytosine-specific restriction endonuclease McrA
MAEKQYRWAPGQRTRIFARDTRHCETLNKTLPHCRIEMAHCTHEATHIDHIIPGRVGGSQDDMNLRAACFDCNQDRRNHVNTPTPTHQEYW